MVTIKALEDVARCLRRDVLEATTKAGSGHPTSCLSSAELASVLFFSEMSYDPRNGFNPDNDEFVLSKGHAAPLLYSLLKRAGCISESLGTLRAASSPLEGHPIPPLHGWVKVASGSLGQGLGVGVGMALAARLDSRTYRTYVLMGDSECAEGSVWEAVQLAQQYKLSNLCAIVDVNRLGQRGETMLGHDLKAYKKRFESFGWNALVIDGHDLNQITQAFKEARKSSSPSVILAQTIKGKGVSFLENQEGWHGRALKQMELDRALAELPSVPFPKLAVKKPKANKVKVLQSGHIPFSSYPFGEPVAPRMAYGNALATLTSRDPSSVVLDAEVSNSTYADKSKSLIGDRFIESYIAEQTMISIALGLAVKGKNVFASTFAAFLTRAHDQLRMASLSKARFTVCGSHAGVSIGEDGASQMGLEDIALFRSLPSSNVFYPSDALSTEKLLHATHSLPGISYLRTTRAALPQLYTQQDDFPVGDFKVLRSNGHDDLVIIGAGITVHESLKAYVLLKKERISAAVVDLYSIKPLNADKLVQFIREHGNRVLVVEDHYPEGGIGESIAGILSKQGLSGRFLAVKATHSGTKEQALQQAGIDAFAIAEASQQFIRPPRVEEEKIVFSKPKKQVKKKKRK